MARDKKTYSSSQYTHPLLGSAAALQTYVNSSVCVAQRGSESSTSTPCSGCGCHSVRNDAVPPSAIRGRSRSQQQHEKPLLGGNRTHQTAPCTECTQCDVTESETVHSIHELFVTLTVKHCTETGQFGTHGSSRAHHDAGAVGSLYWSELVDWGGSTRCLSLCVCVCVCL